MGVLPVADPAGPAIITYCSLLLRSMLRIPRPPKSNWMGAPKVADPVVPPVAEIRVVKLVTGTIRALSRLLVGSLGARKAT